MLLGQFGCTLLRAHHVIDGQRLLNDALVEAMRTGRSDGFIPPYALFILGGAASDGITYVFYDHLTRAFLSGPDFLGLEASANRFGRAAFLADQQAVETLLKKHAKKWMWDDIFQSRLVTPPSFLKMLRSLRQVMGILARDPVMVDTGQYQPKYQQRTYADMEGQIANELSSKLPNFHAKVKLLSGEHVIRTHPAPNGLSGEALAARIRAIKERMISLGYVRYAREVEKEIADRHEQLRSPGEDRPRRRHAADDPPPTHF